MIRLIVGIILSSITIGLNAQQRMTRPPSPQELYLQLQESLNSTDSPDSIIEIYTTYALQNLRRNPDTTEAVLKRMNEMNGLPELKLGAHSDLIRAELLSRPYPDSALKYVHSSIRKFQQLDNLKPTVGILNLESRIHSQLNNYLEAEETLIQAIEIARSEEVNSSNEEINNLLNRLADMYMRVGATEIAVQRYQQMLEIETSKERECRIRINISNAFKSDNRMEEAKLYLEPCLDETSIALPVQIAVIKSYSDLEKNLGNYDERLFYIKKAVSLQEQTSYRDLTAYLFLAEAYFDKQEYFKSDSVLQLVGDRELQRVQPFTQFHIHFLKAKLLHQANKFDEALAVLDQALRILERLPETPLEIDVYTLQAQIYSELGDYKKAYDITKTSETVSDILKERMDAREEANSKVRFQMRAKNQELADVTSELGTVKTRNAVIIILLVLLSSYILYRFRVHFLLKEERTRNKIARDLHDDLSATLSSISFFSEAAKREDSNGPNRFLQRIDESAVEAKEKINDIIWAIDPGNDDWESFLTKCKRFSAEMFESKNIAYKIDIDAKAEIPINIKARKDLWLIFKEIITNLVRHSESSNAKVVLKSTKESFILTVEEDGIGFDTQKNYKGNGLTNIKKRVSSISESGNLILESEPKEGTRWELTLYSK
ncbi:MAG: tetratricopeptide repeat protein [Balneola sp.]|nr:tetratricopeptide repeat protein [Balneola sp.]MBO6651612.1 tetratricopeptide repeat protein [Balneola sp.]MBO6710722.1 tetratricopeptide repeat protein [Balneola sp.]MBO6799408.1 tetratricopeptide repeat protein [Balneola sp.]MBO6869463.1 tetratricopeptide repeat protein [Balneola sp.]